MNNNKTDNDVDHIRESTIAQENDPSKDSYKQSDKSIEAGRVQIAINKEKLQSIEKRLVRIEDAKDKFKDISERLRQIESFKNKALGMWILFAIVISCAGAAATAVLIILKVYPLLS